MKYARVGALSPPPPSSCRPAVVEQRWQQDLKIGISFPLSGSSLASAGPARDGALLAIKEANDAGR